MNRNQIIALAIGILMISSTIGFAFLSVTNQQPGNPDTSGNTDNTPVPPASEIKFKADSQKAKVVDILPLIKIFGATSEYDIQKIDASIYGITGVKKISSVFDTTSASSLTYVAEISLEPGLSPQMLVKEITGRKILSSPDGVSYAVVELPKKIVFQSENSDLNLSKEYEFADSQGQALIGFGSIKGDEILVSVSATFAGSKLVNLISVEEENLTAKQLSGTASLELPIKSLEPNLVFSAKAFFSNNPASEELKSKISQIQDFNSVEIEAASIAPKITLSGETALPEEQVHDLNVFVQSLNPQSASFFNQGGFSASIPFDSDANLADAKARLEAQLKTMGLENVLAEENSGTLYGNVSLQQTGTGTPALQLRQVLDSYSLLEIQILQPAGLELSGIFDANANATYAIDSNSIPAQIKPGHSIGEKLKASILYYTSRGKIIYIAAEEE
ncbi:MAG: hypothetical protein PHD95_03955 [Candidatus ainarchaeum sp.]|nr:hypothetical protein [Candidatus ainarchaeum sp.]